MPIESVGMPGYGWDERTRRFINLQSRQFVSQRNLSGLVRGYTAGADGTLEALARMAQQGSISPRQFFELFGTQLRLYHQTFAAMGAGGWERLSPTDWLRIGERISADATRLVGFAADIASGQLSEAQILSRAKMYGDTAYGEYWRYADANAQALGRQEHWRTAKDERVCVICNGLERQGWVPAGSNELPNHLNCRCQKEFRTPRARKKFDILTLPWIVGGDSMETVAAAHYEAGRR